MRIYELRLTNLGPFDEADFAFDPHVNVLVGPNNCGKSTALFALASIAIESFDPPEKLVREANAGFRVHLGGTQDDAHEFAGRFCPTRVSGPLPPSDDFPEEHDFPDEESAERYRHTRDDALTFERSMRWVDDREKLGYTCLIPALRWNTDYRAEAARPDRPIIEYAREPRMSFGLGDKSGKAAREHSMRASLMQDDALIQKIVDLDYRAFREDNPAIRQILHKIAAVASEITEGFGIEFAAVRQGKYGLYPEFKTPDGTLPFSALSQGTQSIIQWLGFFLIGYAEHYNSPKSLDEKPGVLIIDEIDAHMHPSWQRRILPALSRHFPSVQIFCSSHSPFVLAGLKAGQAQLLRRDAKGRVTVSRNQSDLVGWSVDEILRNFLDITNPTDLQTSENIQRLQELRSKKRLTRGQKEELEHLRETVSRDLLAGPAGMELERLAERVRNPATESRSRGKATATKKKAKKASTARTRGAGTKGTGRQR